MERLRRQGWRQVLRHAELWLVAMSKLLQQNILGEVLDKALEPRGDGGVTCCRSSGRAAASSGSFCARLARYWVDSRRRLCAGVEVRRAMQRSILRQRRRRRGMIGGERMKCEVGVWRFWKVLRRGIVSW